VNTLTGMVQNAGLHLAEIWRKGSDDLPQPLIAHIRDFGDVVFGRTARDGPAGALVVDAKPDPLGRPRFIKNRFSASLVCMFDCFANSVPLDSWIVIIFHAFIFSRPTAKLTT
jgi:hypothetical protein